MATNLFGRGMDIERVNIVFNYDMPEDTDTYLHRVARAGRCRSHRSFILSTGLKLAFRETCKQSFWFLARFMVVATFF